MPHSNLNCQKCLGRFEFIWGSLLSPCGRSSAFWGRLGGGGMLGALGTHEKWHDNQEFSTINIRVEQIRRVGLAPRILHF